ncbi:MAG: metal-dependent hydrolase [Bdellovibrionota bacterium]|nr:MAG: metal-dependent hydrolase [Bdellovibrionota bacterium]
MTIQTVRYLGHSAVFLEGSSGVIAIDPWLSSNPSCPAEYRSPKRIDLIVLSHGHSDHASDAAQLAKQTGAKIAATFELACLLQSEGVPSGQLVMMNKGGTVNMGKLSVSLTQAFHSSSYDTSDGPRYAGEPCGVVVRDGRHSFYHSGDTALFSDMTLIGTRYKPSIAFVCIGDVFTMGPSEAAQAVHMLGAKVAVPIHYGTFPALTGTAEEFALECEQYGIHARVMNPGDSWAL